MAPSSVTCQRRQVTSLTLGLRDDLSEVTSRDSKRKKELKDEP